VFAIYKDISRTELDSSKLSKHIELPTNADSKELAIYMYILTCHLSGDTAHY